MTSFGAAAGAAWWLDQQVGEPPAAWHPVAWFGTAMRRVERLTYRDTRTAGVLHLAVGVGLAVGAGSVLPRVLGRQLATLAATTIAVAGRMLADEASSVLASVADGDVTESRRRVARLVGRDVSAAELDEVTRAVIETTAENTVDAVTAPLVWAAIGGAPAVLAYRAINTLDAMVGHRSARYERFGWASARADDLANWVPARLTAVATALVTPRRIRAIVGTVRRDARRHPSPNGGVIEAAFAAALGVRLGGVNRYGDVIEDRGVLGDGPPPSPADGVRAITLARRVGAAMAAASVVATVGRTARPRAAA